MAGKALRRPALALMASTAIAFGMLSGPVAAQSNDELRQRIEVMEKQLQELKQRLETTDQKATEAKQKATEAKQEAKAEENAAINFHFGGYGTANFTHASGDGMPDFFGAGQFSPIFMVGYKDLLLFESEVELSAQSDGDTKVELEFANLNLMPTDWLTFTAGKFLSPIGDFQQHQHPSWINKLPDRPAGFVEDGGVEPLTDIGVMARGAFPLGSMTADYAVYVGNGPRLADEAAEAVLHEGFAGDINKDKAFGGRIGLHPVPYVTLGFSGLYTRIKGNQGTGGGVSQASYDLEDIDASYTRGNFDIRGEFIRAHMDSLTTALDSSNPPAPISATTWYAWYVQAAYRLAGLTDDPILRNFEPVVRFSQFSISGVNEFEENAENRWTIGLDYWIAPSIVAKLAYEHRDFLHQDNQDVARLQFAFGF
jgi:hypothetical protein